MRAPGLIPVLLGSVALTVASIQACGGDPETTRGNSSFAEGGAAGTGGTGGDSGAGGDGGSGAIVQLPDGGEDADTDACVGDVCDEPEPACGDGNLDPGEVCDDMNSEAGDGCSTNCDAIEKDWACPTPGQPCVFLVECGDGQISGDETCDDQNANPGDGCSADCQVEPGWRCGRGWGGVHCR